MPVVTDLKSPTRFDVKLRPALRRLQQLDAQINAVDELRRERNKIMFELTEQGLSQMDIVAFLGSTKISVFKMVDTHRKSIETTGKKS